MTANDRWVYLTLGPNRAERRDRARAAGQRVRLRLGHPADLCPPAKKLIFEPSINRPYRKGQVIT